MKYQLIGENDILNPIDQVLKNRGIKDIKRFLKARNNLKETIHYSKLDNINEATDCLIEHVHKDSSIFIQIDSDPDGYLSSAMLILYLKKLFPSIKLEYRLHEGKQHGIIPETVPEDIDLVIVPDASSMEYKEHKELKDRGVDVIVLDHHETDKYSKDAIVVNNQLSSNYENKALSGTGVTYKFLKALDEKLEIDYSDEFLDMVAVSLVSDNMDMTSFENRYYVTQGFKRVNNPLLKELFDSISFNTGGHITITSAGFNVVPLINAAIRIGSDEEKDQLFKSLIDDKNTEIYYERGKRDEKLVTNTVRMLKRLKKHQDKLRDKATEEILEKIEEKNLLDHKILIVEVTDILDKNLTGLVANSLATTNNIQRPTLLARFKEDGDNILAGSGRGYENGQINNFKELLLDTKLFKFVEGHPNAFGFNIEANKLIKVRDIINEKYKDVDLGSGIHKIDFMFKARHFTRTFVSEINDFRDLWGKSVSYPLVLIKEIRLDKTRILLEGKNKNVLKFNVNNIEFIKYGSNEEEYENIVAGEKRQVELNVIGQCTENHWGKRKTMQLRIEDFDSKEIETGFLF